MASYDRNKTKPSGTAAAASGDAESGRRPRFKVLPSQFGLNYDHHLLITILILCSFGLVMVYSSSAYGAAIDSKTQNEYYYVVHEGVFMAAGIVIMLLVSKLDYHIFIRWTPLLYVVSLILMVLVNTPVGVKINGQRRWLHLIPFIKQTPTYQPTEIVKIAVILVFAYMINRCIKNIDETTVMLTMIVLLAPLAGLVLINNLSSGIIISGIGALMYFTASKRKRIYWVTLVLISLLVVIAYFSPDILNKFIPFEGYHLTRIKIWRDPSSDRLGKGFQVLQGLYAIGSGGLFGKGLGGSVQKLGFIPEAYNDMIFSIICEELGIFGAACVMGFFAYMLYRFVYIILRAKDLYGAMIVVGVMIHIALQVILNIAVVTNTIPNTGVTLPFISYGGTSVVILLAEMGLVLSVSNQIVYEK